MPSYYKIHKGILQKPYESVTRPFLTIHSGCEGINDLKYQSSNAFHTTWSKMDAVRHAPIMPLDVPVLRCEPWATLALLLLLCGFSALFCQFIRQPSFPDGAPRPLKEGYPTLGALRFFSDRYNMYFDGISSSRTGSFSFYFGKHQIVGISGLEGRKVFFQSKEMDLSQGLVVVSAVTFRKIMSAYYSKVTHSS